MLSIVMLAGQTIGGASGDVKNGLAEKIAGFFEYIVGQVPSWIAGFIVFALTIIVAKMAKAAVEARISDQVDEEHQEILVLAGRVTYFGTLALGVTIALKIAGIDLTTILAAVAFGIGFALQDLIMNFLAGVMILVSRQFTIGDFIKVGATMGKVMEIQTRATILKAVDGTKVIVPNSEIFTSQVVSYTSNPLRRVVIPLYVSYDTDLKYATKITMEVMKKHPKILKKPPPTVIIKDYGDSTVDLAARFWVGSRDGWVKVKSEIMRQMLEAYDEAGIVVPYNIVHVENEQDTSGWVKEYDGIAKKRMEEMRLSKAIAQDAAAANVTNGATPAATQPAGSGAVAAVGAVLNATTPAPMPLATEAVVAPIEPEGAYTDQIEIDGQA